jgi:hypothetical protein
MRKGCVQRFFGGGPDEWTLPVKGRGQAGPLAGRMLRIVPFLSFPRNDASIRALAPAVRLHDARLVIDTPRTFQHRLPFAWRRVAACPMPALRAPPEAVRNVDRRRAQRRASPRYGRRRRTLQNAVHALETIVVLTLVVHDFCRLSDIFRDPFVAGACKLEARNAPGAEVRERSHGKRSS